MRSTDTVVTQRSFGGKSGTWFRGPQLESKPISELGGKPGTLKKPLRKKAGIGNRIVGWDDVLCRPIYNKIGEVDRREKEAPEEPAKKKRKNADVSIDSLN